MEMSEEPELSFAAFTTSEGIPLLPGAFPQDSESIALLSSMMVGGESSSFIVVSGVVFSMAVSACDDVHSGVYLQHLIVLDPSLHLLATVIDDVARGGLEECDLAGTS